MTTTLEVFDASAGIDRLVGHAHVTRSRRLSTTFIYDPDYLAGGGMSIDPALPLVPGAQHQQGLVRAFADGAPDRWGRNLIDKAERAQARQERRAPRRLDDLDYLLRVSDTTRQGALRFRVAGDDEFAGSSSEVPRLAALPTLLHASDQLDVGEDSSQAVKDLLDTGTTGLGGARPKASVRLEDGALVIAKFPHASDGWDVMAWEFVALDLLAAAGARVPEHRLIRVGDRSVLVVRRFDRTGKDNRVGYMSGLTAVGAEDGQERDYADLALAVRELSGSPRADLAELYRRVVVNVALGNTDDHLRNHGFLASGGTWQLCPAFDVNPDPRPGATRATSIAGADRLDDEVDGLLALADDCDLSLDDARQELARVARAVGGWAEQARATGIAEREITMMGESIGRRLRALAEAGRG